MSNHEEEEKREQGSGWARVAKASRAGRPLSLFVEIKLAYRITVALVRRTT